MNSTDNSLQNHVYELLDAVDMLVIVKSESYSNMGDFIRNSVTVQPRIDIMYMNTEEEKVVVDDVCKTISKEDIDKLGEAIDVRKTAEAIQETTDVMNSLQDTLIEIIIQRLRGSMFCVREPRILEFATRDIVEDSIQRVAMNIAKYVSRTGKAVVDVKTYFSTLNKVKGPIKETLADMYNIDNKDEIKYAGALAVKDDGTETFNKLGDGGVLELNATAPIHYPSVHYRFDTTKNVLSIYVVYPCKKLVEEHNKPVDENDGLDLRWPNKLAKDLLASTLRTCIQNTVGFNIPLNPARVAKVVSNIINNIVLPNGLSIEKDTLKITCRICEKEDLKKAIDGNCLVRYAGNIGSDEDSTEVYDGCIYYGYNIVEAHLHEVIAYDPVFYSSISSKIEGGTLSGDIDIYIMKASIVAEEE